jgi:hypothetical protein
VALCLNGSKHPKLSAKVRPLVDHLETTTKGDFLFLVDGHADYQSGEIIYGRNADNDDVSDAADVVSIF